MGDGGGSGSFLWNCFSNVFITIKNKKKHTDELGGAMPLGPSLLILLLPLLPPPILCGSGQHSDSCWCLQNSFSNVFITTKNKTIYTNRLGGGPSPSLSFLLLPLLALAPVLLLLRATATGNGRWVVGGGDGGGGGDGSCPSVQSEFTKFCNNYKE